VRWTRLTEDLGGPITEERRRRSDPKWVAPIAVWLASEESSDVSGRMFESSGNTLAIAEGWHRGPTAQPVEDPKKLGPIVAEMMAKARKNAGMDGKDLIRRELSPSGRGGVEQLFCRFHHRTYDGFEFAGGNWLLEHRPTGKFCSITSFRSR